MTTDERLKEIENRLVSTPPCFDRESHEYITHACRDIPFLLALVRKQREALMALVESGIEHDDLTCPEDDTCVCQTIRLVNEALK